MATNNSGELMENNKNQRTTTEDDRLPNLKEHEVRLNSNNTGEKLPIKELKKGDYFVFDNSPRVASRNIICLIENFIRVGRSTTIENMDCQFIKFGDGTFGQVIASTPVHQYFPTPEEEILWVPLIAGV